MPDINYCSIIIAEITALFSLSKLYFKKTHYLTVLPINEPISQMKCGTVVLFDSNYSLHLNNVLRVTVRTDMWRMLIDRSTPRDWGETALYQQFSHPCDYINRMCVYQCMCVIESEGTTDCEFSRHITIRKSFTLTIFTIKTTAVMAFILDWSRAVDQRTDRSIRIEFLSFVWNAVQICCVNCSRSQAWQMLTFWSFMASWAVSWAEQAATLSWSSCAAQHKSHSHWATASISFPAPSNVTYKSTQTFTRQTCCPVTLRVSCSPL